MSCERPSNSSARVRVPSSVSKRYTFSSGTQGSSRRCRASSSPSRVCSFSRASSAARAASHSSRLPILRSVIGVLSFPSSMVVCRKGRSRVLLFWPVMGLGGRGEGRLFFVCGAGGACEVVAADEQEGDRDRGEADRAADPERPLEAAGERGRGGRTRVGKGVEVGGGDGGGD